MLIKTHLFLVEVDKETLWNLYLDSFPPGANEVYRTRREYDCSCCRHFVKSFGNVVSIQNNEVVTLWDFEAPDPVFAPVLQALSAYVKAAAVRDVLASKQASYGTDKSLEQLESGQVQTWVGLSFDCISFFLD